MNFVVTFEERTSTSGSNNGSCGCYVPVRGVDYWTEEDKQEIINAVLAALGQGSVNTTTAVLGVAKLGSMKLA